MLHFWRLEQPFELIMHSDISYVNLEDGSSQSGMFIFLKGKNNLLQDISTIQKDPERSQAHSSCRNFSFHIWSRHLCLHNIKYIFEEILGKYLPSLSCFAGNKSLFEAAHSTKILQDRCLCLHTASLRQAIYNNEFIIKWVNAQQQLADLLTK